jgi:hypothetical protein
MLAFMECAGSGALTIKVNMYAIGRAIEEGDSSTLAALLTDYEVRPYNNSLPSSDVPAGCDIILIVICSIVSFL